MSKHGSTSGFGPHEIDTDNLSGAYSLNALSEEERTAFEARLAESDDIRTEVAELNETALLLGRAVEPVQPSAALRSSIMDLIGSTPQLPKLETSEQDHDGSVPETTTARASAPEPAGELLQPIPLARQRWFMRPAVLLAGAAAAVGLFFGGGAALNSHQPNPGSSSVQAQGMSQILAAADVQHTVSDVSTGGKATLYWSDKLQRSAVVLDGVSSLPSSKTYQLWYINGSHISSAGTLDATSNNPSQVLVGDLKKGDTIGITIEPQGGSKQPTTKPIVAIQSA